MNHRPMPFGKDRRLKLIIILAVVAASMTQIFGLTELALGVLAGTPIGIFNYWMMWDAVQKGEKSANKQANKMFFGRALIRMAISVIALIIALQVGVHFLIGVMVGLFLHLLTYSTDVISILTGKKF